MTARPESEPIFRLPARKVEAILAELQSLRTRASSTLATPAAGEQQSDEVPGISLLLDSGHTVTGELVSYDPEAATVLVKNHPGPGALDVTYVPVAAIRALTVGLTPRNIHALSFGRIKKRAGKVPARLELEREARSIAEAMGAKLGQELPVSIAWPELPSSDDAYFSMQAFLGDLRFVLADIVADELGLSSLRSKVKRVAVHPGAAPGVALRDGTLEILAAPDGPDIALVPRATLRDLVGKLL